MTELAVLQAVRLKGRVSPADLAVTLDKGLAEIVQTVEQLGAAGLLIEGPTLRISPRGRARLVALLAEERTGADSPTLTAAYDQFRLVNADFKALVTDWQLKGGAHGERNTHEDAEYDAAVLARLARVHERVVPIIAAIATELPRLGAYSTKLGAALDRVNAGEIAWVSRPLIDSYHTVWFELHEELILAVGLTRDEEAKSGDAQ
jgi:hypothetical protein